MENLFKTIFGDTITIGNVIAVIIAGLIIGIAISLVAKYRSESTKSFFITTSIMPSCIAMVIMLVNGNIGAGIAVAGAFSLIRFRSATGSAKEIAIIFIDMEIGLALGMGYIGYSVVFSIIVMAVFFALANTKLFDEKSNTKDMKLKIMVPEDLDYSKEFNKIFENYLSKAELVKIKSALMGSMFQLTYDVTFKNVKQQKQFLDEVRTKNSNLEVLLEKHTYEEKDL